MQKKVQSFNEFAFNYFSTLRLFTTAVSSAHGKDYPETLKVQTLFERIKTKTEEAGSKKPNLDTEFTQLREVIHNYTLHKDACMPHAKVYKLLAEADEAYQT